MKRSTNKPHLDYDNWYVLHIFNGSEKRLIDTIRNFSGKKYTLYLPQREVIHSRKGRDCIRKMPLFPGYLFVHKDIEGLTRQLAAHNLDATARPLVAGDRYQTVYEHEMKHIFDMTDPNGIIPLSRGIVNPEGEVEIVKGPLKDFSGEVQFINKRKKKAKIRMSIMNTHMDVTLGFEILQNKTRGR